MEIGELVQLKTGGPIMVINGKVPGYNDRTVSCVWFNKETGHFEEYLFAIESLKEINKCEDLLLEENREAREEALLPDEM